MFSAEERNKKNRKRIEGLVQNMKKKKWMPLVVCVVLLVILFVVYFILKNQNEKLEEEENADTSIQVLNVAKEDVDSIRFMLDGKEETFTLQDETWKLESDETFEVDGDVIDSLVTAITEMTADRKLEEVTDLSEYGLDEPVQTAVLTDKEGNTYTVYWGDSNSMTSNDYIYINDENDVVYTVSYSVLESFKTTLEEYRKQEEETTEGDTAEESMSEEDTAEE